MIKSSITKIKPKVVSLLTDKERFIHKASLVIGWTSLSQIIVFLGIPFITRLYLPEIYGLYAIYNSIMYILNGMVALRGELLIALPKDDDEAYDTFIAALINVFMVNVVISVLLFLFANVFSHLFHLQQLKPYFWLIPVGGVFLGLRNCLIYWIMREGFFSQVGFVKFIQSPIMIVIQIAIGFVYPSIFVLVSAVAISYLFAVLYMLFILWRRGSFKRFNTSFSRASNIIRKNKHFLVNSSLYMLLLGLSTYMPILMMSAAYGPKVAAWFALAMQAVSPFDLINNAVGQIYINEGGKLVHDNPAKLKPFYFKTMKGLTLLAIIPMLVLALFGGSLFSIVFGGQWYQAGVYAQVLSLMVLVRFVVVSASQNLAVLKKQGIALFWSILFIILMFASFLPAYLSAGAITPVKTLIILSINMLIAYGLMVFLNLFVINRHLNNEI